MSGHTHIEEDVFYVDYTLNSLVKVGTEENLVATGITVNSDNDVTGIVDLTMSGDLYLTSGATIDVASINYTGDVGFGVSGTVSARVHAEKTTEQLRLGYDATNYASFTVGAEGDMTIATVDADATNGSLTLAPDGNILVNPTGNNILPVVGCDNNIGSLGKKFLSIYAAELVVQNLVAQDVIATIGGRIVVGPTTYLIADADSGDSTIDVAHNEMTTNDVAYLENNGQVEFMIVTSAPPTTITGGYRYAVTRSHGTPTAKDWKIGDAVFNTGGAAATDGFIDIYSRTGINTNADGTEATTGPTIVGNVRNSTTYNDWTEHWAIGNLNGLYGYGSSTIGVGLGIYGDDYLTMDATNGIRMYNNNVLNLQLLANGTLTVGEVGASKSNVLISSGAIDLRTNTTSHLNLSTAGAITVGEVGASKSNVLISSGVLQMRVNTAVYANLAVDGILSLGATGAEHVLINTSGVALKDSTTTYATFAATTNIGVTTTEHVSITSTAVQIKDGATVLTDISGGNVLVGQTGASQSNVYITSGAVSLRNNETDIITLSNAGVASVTVNAGGDVLLVGSDTEGGKAEIQFQAANQIAMGGANTWLGLGIWTDTTASSSFGIGVEPTNAFGSYVSKFFEIVYVYAENKITLAAIESAGNDGIQLELVSNATNSYSETHAISDSSNYEAYYLCVADTTKGEHLFQLADGDGTLNDVMKLTDDLSVDISAHDASSIGLKLGGTLVTVSAAEINYLEGLNQNLTTTTNVTFGTIGSNTITVAANSDVELSGTGHVTSGSEGFIVGTLTITDGSIDDTDGTIAFGDTNLSSVGTIASNEITVADGHGINLQEDITFTGATTENIIKFPDALANALSFQEATNIYLQFVTTNGSEAVYVAKNLGVGTASPAAPLHVIPLGTAGTPALDGATVAAFQRSSVAGAQCEISIISGASGTANVWFGDTADENIGQISYNHATDAMSFVTNTATAATIDSSGNVGIGTVGPGANVHIHDTSATSLWITSAGSNPANAGSIRFGEEEAASSYIEMRHDGSANALKWFSSNYDSGNSPLVTFMRAGNVGIGTASPDGTCHVHTATAGAVTADAGADDLVVENSGIGGISILTPDANYGNLYFGSPSDNQGAAIRWDHNNDLLTIATHNAGANIHIRSGVWDSGIYIDSSGNVGIGETSLTSLFEVKAADGVKANAYVCHFKNQEATDGQSYGLVVDAGSTNVDRNLLLRTHDNGTTLLELDGAGSLFLPQVYDDDIGTERDLLIQADGQIGYDSSSLESKTNVTYDDIDVSWLYDLRPITFEHNVKLGITRYGLAAEDVELIKPELISYNYERDEDGEIISQTPGTVLYKQLIIPLLIEVQKLKDEIATLKGYH